MRTESLTFYCDASKCQQKHTSPLYGGEVGAYLDLTEAGWKVERPVINGWKHYCPEHVEKESRAS